MTRVQALVDFKYGYDPFKASMCTKNDFSIYINIWTRVFIFSKTFLLSLFTILICFSPPFSFISSRFLITFSVDRLTNPSTTADALNFTHRCNLIREKIRKIEKRKHAIRRSRSSFKFT
ncbi:hypothetical protein ABFS83_01G102600 [Erythranthe nasuta]